MATIFILNQSGLDESCTISTVMLYALYDDDTNGRFECILLCSQELGLFTGYILAYMHTDAAEVWPNG